MTKQIHMNWSDELVAKADAVLRASRKATGEHITRTDLVESLIEQAHAQIQTIEKRIEPVTINRARGKKTYPVIVGFQAFYGDHLVITTDGAGSKPEAQKALDAFVFEELSK